MKAVNFVKTAAWLALLAGIAAAQLKYVAVVETGIDERSGAAAEITSAEVALVTAELRREAVKNLPRDKYSVMTSETVQSMGGAILEECSEENCVVTLGSRIGADYIVRGVISKLRAKFTLSVEIYETDNGTLLASSEPIRSESVEELVVEAAAACAAMYKTFASEQDALRRRSTPPPEPAAPPPPVAYTVAVNVNPDKGGAVSRNPDQTYYAPGTRVNVAAAPARGYTFAGWSGAAADTANPLTITADGDKTLTAEFRKTKRVKQVKEAAPPPHIRKEYTLTTTVSPPDGGTVIRNPDKETYLDGETVTVTAVSASGYMFTGYAGAVSGRTNHVTITMGRDKALTAKFYKRSVTAGAPEDTASKVFAGYDDDGEPIYLTKRIKWTKEDYMMDSTKNVLTADAIPLLISMFGGMYDLWAFGFGLQYERRLNEKYSLLGRYDYFGVWDFSEAAYYYSGADRVKDWSSHLHSFETHARYYPTGKAFFLDGMLGYYVNTISGDYYETSYNNGSYYSTYYYNSSGTYDYFKWGASLGWRIRSRKERGFNWEISFGWNFAVNSHYKGIYDNYYGSSGEVTPYGVIDYYGLFMGGAGPRFVSALGWRF